MGVIEMKNTQKRYSFTKQAVELYNESEFAEIIFNADLGKVYTANHDFEDDKYEVKDGEVVIFSRKHNVGILTKEQLEQRIKLVSAHYFDVFSNQSQVIKETQEEYKTDKTKHWVYNEYRDVTGLQQSIALFNEKGFAEIHYQVSGKEIFCIHFGTEIPRGPLEGGSNYVLLASKKDANDTVTQEQVLSRLKRNVTGISDIIFEEQTKYETRNEEKKMKQIRGITTAVLDFNVSDFGDVCYDRVLNEVWFELHNNEFDVTSFKKKSIIHITGKKERATELTENELQQLVTNKVVFADYLDNKLNCYVTKEATADYSTIDYNSIVRALFDFNKLGYGELFFDKDDNTLFFVDFDNKSDVAIFREADDVISIYRKRHENEELEIDYVTDLFHEAIYENEQRRKMIYGN